MNLDLLHAVANSHVEDVCLYRANHDTTKRRGQVCGGGGGAIEHARYYGRRWKEGRAAGGGGGGWKEERRGEELKGGAPGRGERGYPCFNVTLRWGHIDVMMCAFGRHAPDCYKLRRTFHL